MDRDLSTPLPPLSPQLRELIERAYRARGAIAEAMVARCRERFPHYRALAGSELEELRRNANLVVGAFYRLQLLQGREPTSEELEPPRRSARLRYAQGIPLEEMIGSYQSGLPLLWADLVAAVEAAPEIQGELLRRIPVTISAMTRLTTAVTEAYVEERERSLRSRGEAVDELLRLFTHGEASLASLTARARALGLALDAPRVAVLFRPPFDDDAASGSALDVVRRFLSERRLLADAVMGRIEQGVLALLPEATDGAALADFAGKLRGHGWRTGLGEPGAGAAALRRSIREAARALEIGEILGRETPLDRFADLAVLDLVDVGSPRAAEFARQVLGSLADPETNPALLLTLRALCKCGFRHKLAAAELGVHPHTLSYRVAQIRRRHGIDLERAETRLRVHLAVSILDV
jgi:sugar diacid utilization regulator